MMKYSGKKVDRTYMKRVMIGLGVMALCVVLATMLVTTFTISGTLAESKLEVVAAASLFISALIGSFTVRSVKGQGNAKAILIYAGCNVALILLCSLLLSKGITHNFLMKLGLLVLGSAAGLLNSKSRTKKYKKIINK